MFTLNTLLEQIGPLLEVLTDLFELCTMIFENEIHLLEETNFLLENGRLIRTFLRFIGKSTAHIRKLKPKKGIHAIKHVCPT